MDLKAVHKATRKEYNRMEQRYRMKQGAAFLCRAEFSMLARSALEWAERTYSLPTHGVCRLQRRNGTAIYYLNTGDSYGTTLLATVTHSGVKFSIGDWGTLAENDPSLTC